MILTFPVHHHYHRHYLDPSSGLEYYFNTDTEEVSWEKPEQLSWEKVYVDYNDEDDINIEL